MALIKKSVTSVVLLLSLAWMAWLTGSLGRSEAPADGQGGRITVVVYGTTEPTVLFALKELEAAAATKGLSIRRVSSEREAESEPIILVGRMPTLSQPIKEEPPRESVRIAHSSADGKRVLHISGGDRGRMYALLEIARVLSHAKSPIEALATMPAVEETPELAVRGIVQFLHNADLEKEWYYSEEYWQAYFALLAKSRFNSFNLVFAHQTAYMAPPYPFLVKVDKYPQIRVPGLSDADRERNLRMLQYISRQAKEHGIDFIMGIWEHMAWKRGQKSMVEGLTDDNVTEYTRVALTQLLRAGPDIAGIQLRVNTESGIENKMQTAFYRDGVLAAMKDAGRPVLLDLRGWGALPGTIEAATQSGLPMRLSMKYWAEFMGFPYEPAETPPSYSYADFLRYPRAYPVMQQVWSLGSHRLLLWGDPEYVRRFAPTCHLSEGVGFEICAPLSQKGYGNAPGAWRIFTSRDREYYRWEFERYWMYYLLFGRLTYNPKTPDSVWMDELAARFGAAVPDVLEAYKWGSQVIPFLVAYHLSNPNMYVWPEKHNGGLMDFYLDTYPSDKARIADLPEAAENYLNDAPSAKMKPAEISARLSTMAARCRAALARAAKQVGKDHKEFVATALDMEILSNLADYHARKVRAGEHLVLFYKTGDYASLKRAQAYAQEGLKIWEQLVKITDGVYYPKMVFGPEDVGHWKDNLVFVKQDLARLDEVEKIFDRYGLFDKGFDFGATVPEVRRGFEPLYPANYSVEARFKGVFPDTLYTPQKGYGWINKEGITAQTAPRIARSSLEGTNLNNLRLPSDMLYLDFVRGTKMADFVVDLPNGDYQVLFLMGDITEKPGDHGPMRIALNGYEVANSVHLTKGYITERKIKATVNNSKLTITLSAEEGKDWILNGLIITRMAPHIGHVPVRVAEPSAAQRIEASIQSPNGIEEVRLYYKGESVTEYQSLKMRSEGLSYRETIPARAMVGRAVSYYIEAKDKAGQVARFPSQEAFTIHVGRDRKPPVISHQPIRSCDPKQPLTVRAQVTDDSTVRLVRLHYRYVNQMQPFRRVRMEGDGRDYQATIPADYIGTTWDLMYYIEAVDEFDNGIIYPDPDKTVPYVIVKINR